MWFGISDKREFASLKKTYHVRQSGKGLTNSLTVKNRRSSNKKNNTRNFNTGYYYQDIVKIKEQFKSIYSQNFKCIKKHEKNRPSELYLFLVNKLSKLIKGKNTL